METTNLLRSVRRIIICSVGAALCSGVVCTATADNPFFATQSVKVRFADLNLAHAEGIEELYRRIRRAARTVCAVQAAPSDWRSKRAVKECEQLAIANAVDAVNNELLTAMHRQKRDRTFG